MSPSSGENTNSSEPVCGSQTQPFSQVIYPPPAFAYEVDDEEAEGVWGYLVPIDGKSSKFGTLVLKQRETCMASDTSHVKEGSAVSRGKYKEQEKAIEKKKERKSPSRGYLLGRHPECGE
jgi:serine/threonine-protein kinase CHEK2